MGESWTSVTFAGKVCHFQITTRWEGKATDHIQKHWLKSVFYEANAKGVLRFLYDHLPKGGDYLALDIGAHQGNHSVFFGAVMGWHCVAFEPDAENYRLLRANLERNGLARQVGAEQMAIGARRGIVRLTKRDPNNSGMVRAEYADKQAAANVPCMALDFLSTKRIDVIKVDVEGFEIEALRGATGLIALRKPVLIVETDRPGTVRKMLPPGYNRVARSFNATPTFIFAHPDSIWYDPALMDVPASHKL